MNWAASLTRADLGDFRIETGRFDAKTTGAYALVVLEIRAFGSVPADDKVLATIARCTRNFWNKRVWPQIQHIFEYRDGHLFHPDLEDTTREARRQAAARIAAKARWGRANLTVVSSQEEDEAASESHASASESHHANACESHTENHAISMPGAFEPHRESDAIASSDASQSVRAPSPSLASLASFSSPQGKESPEDSKGVGEGAGAGADASGDAPADASGMRPHAITQCVTASRTHPAAPPKASPIAPDWQPSPETCREARRRNYDPDAEIDAFRDHYLANGDLKANWEAAFLSWCRKAPSFAASRNGSGRPPAKPGRFDHLTTIFNVGRGRTIDQAS
jgi:uncharacterized protein YdaU (DUF1376 family)